MIRTTQAAKQAIQDDAVGRALAYLEREAPNTVAAITHLVNVDKWDTAQVIDYFETIYGKINTSWFEWPRGKHSQKPEAFQDIVQQVCPGAYLEMFARRYRLGWDVWGNEVESSLELPKTASDRADYD